MFVSEIRLGDNCASMNHLYEAILQKNGHKLSKVTIFDYEPTNPDLSDKIKQINPDVIFLATASSIPSEYRNIVYDHLRAFGKPILVGDLALPRYGQLEIAEGDRYINSYNSRDRLHMEIPQALDELLGN